MTSKNQLISVPKLWIVLLSIVLFSNCENNSIENDSTQNRHKSFLQTQFVSASDIKQNDKLSAKLKHIKIPSKWALNRTVYNADNDLFIETERVKYMESPDGSFHSFTFPISRNSSEETLQNLVLSSYNDSDYSATLLSYHLAPEQYTELIGADHISSGYMVEAENLDGDFSNVLSRDNDLCDYVAVTYHVTPDTEETWVFDEDSVCQHIDPESGESECFVHTITYLDCPDSVDGSGNSTTAGNGSDWTWSYTGGGSSNGSTGYEAIGSSPSPPMFSKEFSLFINSLSAEQQNLLNSSITHFNFKLELQNFLLTNGYTTDNEDFANALINTLMEYPNLSFFEVFEHYFEEMTALEISLVANDNFESPIEFNSFEEFNTFIEEFRNSVTVNANDFDALLFNQDGTTITKFKAKFNTILPLYLNVHVQSILDDELTQDNNEFDLETINSFITGWTIAIDWVQDSFFVSSENESTIEFTIHGHFDFGLKIKGIDAAYSENWTVTVLMDKQTGEAIDIDASSD